MSMTAEELEQRLAAIPPGATSAAPAPRSTQQYERMFPRRGSYACVRGCGAAVEMPGVCAACGSAARRADARHEFALALDSIPEAFRWTLDAEPPLAKRVRTWRTRSGAVDAPDILDKMAVGIGAGSAPFWTLRGATGAGKTSLACAVIAAICASAIEVLLTIPLPGSREHERRQAHREPHLVRLARGARFIPAADLLPPTDRADDRPAMFGAARRATILVLDDVGKELSAREDVAVTALRAGTTRELIEYRWNARLPTIITTALDGESIARNYDGGTYRRIVEDKQVRFLNWGDT